MIRPLIKIFGGQFYFKEFIISNFPKDYQIMNYIEPFIGGGSVFLNKKESIYEIINDANPATASIWLCVKYYHEVMIRTLSEIKYCEESFKTCKAIMENYGGNISIKDANYPFNYDLVKKIGMMEYVVRRMSRSGLGKDFSKSNRLRGGKMGDENAWLTSIKNIEKVWERLYQTRIKNEDFMVLLDENNNEHSLLYLDPPYLNRTRKSKKAYGIFEMSDERHIEMLNFMKNSKSKILISGYDSELYNKKLKDWNKVSKSCVNNSSQKSKKEKKIAFLWKNY